MKLSKLITIGIAALAPLAVGVSHGPAFSHSGGIDSAGCHHNWTDGSGDHHCL